MEDKDFIGKEFLQKCGDILKVLRKSEVKKNNTYLFECEFKKYPYTFLAKKAHILQGCVNNPQIEQVEFVDKIWSQNCGDSLKILRKTEEQGKNKHYLFECEFIKYPYKILTYKENIIRGLVMNPRIEEEEFIGKEYLQHCGSILKVLKKTDLKKNDKGNYLYKCQFLGDYPSEVYGRKGDILNGEINNPALPWKSKENLENYIKENFKDKKPTLQELSNSLKLSLSHISNIIGEFELSNCIFYFPDFLENFIKDFIISLNVNNIFFNKTFKEEKEKIKYFELDIYLKSFNLGIEINGNYWHSSFKKTYSYHQDKSLFFKNKDIKVLHIFEYEWNDFNKQNIIKNIIKSKLGIFDKKIYARQCEIKEIDNIVYKNFCNKNHLQGYEGAKIKLGLYYKEELVQVMSFSSPRFTDKYEWEIIRECSKLGYCILGGKERLWKYFIRNYNSNSVISYCDFSKFSGDSYLKLGFENIRLNKPGFVWFDLNTGGVFSRSPNKHKEMKDKYIQIYDAGQLVFVWNKK